MLDLDGRRLVMHRGPVENGYDSVDALTDADSVTAARLALTIAVTDLLPPRR